MKIVLANSKDEAIRTVASMVNEKISDHPSAVIGLATGKTMIPMYQTWVEMAREQNVDFGQASFFMLDEYSGISKDHPSSFCSYIRKHLLSPLNIKESQIEFPPAQMSSPLEASLQYENKIKSLGGIDLQLLGIGQNGHIGFNEPGSSKNSRTRKIKLSDETIAVNSVDFEGEMPSEALTMGIETILEAKSLLMLVTGKSKADAVKYLLNHHEDSSCPATFLKNHPHFTLVLDPDAASKINLNI
ncbi:MAG: glucosamine-6-phosphate deaminase [Bacteriovoracaceae bacterium]